MDQRLLDNKLLRAIAFAAFMLLIAAASILMLAGCNTTVPDAPSESPGLSAEQAAVIASDAAKVIAAAVLAVRPAGDLQAIFEQGMPPPACPRLSTSVTGNTFALSLEYNECPLETENVSASGSVTGDFVAPEQSFAFVFTGVALGDVFDALDGTSAGSVTTASEIHRFTLSLNLHDPRGVTRSGTARVSVSRTTREVSISLASLTVGDDLRSATVTLTDVTATPSTRFAPSSGAYQVETAGSPGDEPAVIFTGDFAASN